MLTTQEKQQLKVQTDALQTEIKTLRSTLNELNDQKEKFFEQRNPLGKQISGFIREIKQLRQERDSLTKEVKQAKEERAKLATEIKQKIEAFKKIHGEKKKVETKHAVRENPGKIKQEIERAQYRIETEGLSFEKEKALMKIIRSMEKKLKEIEAMSGLWGETRGLSKEIDQLKDKSDSLHAIIQEKARNSQQKHEKLMEISKKVDELKKQEGELNKQIEIKKKELEEKLPGLDEKKKQFNELKIQLGEDVKEDHIKTEQQKRKKLSELQAEIQQKFRKGEKLTTQDLIILQGMDEK